jgi:hypothetical protein
MKARVGITLALISACVAEPIWAQMDRSPIPLPRPGTAAPFAPVASVTAEASPSAYFASPVPKPRPKLRLPSGTAVQVSYGKKGSVCDMSDIRGRTISAVRGKAAGCGISEPVEITEVAGVRLSTPAIVDCTTAKTLRTWIETGAKPTIGRLGGGLAELHIAASYVCRPRNNQSGAKISEHAKGHAIDISAFTLRNGKSLAVLTGWDQRIDGKLLRKLHSSACGPFSTVLGPESDRHHRDHFHFDTARYRGGSYCR